MAEKKTYEEAMKRLEEIVSQIDNGTLDIDSLSKNLKEAQTLLAFCRDKLYKVDTEIKKLLEAESAADEK
jgi:exodeoxyribonuclease VII small subunit